MGKLRRRGEKHAARVTAPAHTTGSTQHERVLISFAHFNCNCVDACKVEQLKGWLGKLCRLSSMTWSQVTVAGRHAMGSEIIQRDQLKIPLPTTITEDVTLLAFRAAGMMPMIAFRAGAVLNVVWFDHNHTAY